MTGIIREERIGAHRLILGDCREVLPTLGTVDAVVTDPPYGMGWDTDSTRFTGGNHRRGSGRKDFAPIRGDDRPFDPAEFTAIASEWCLWGANHFGARLPVCRTLVWIKKEPQHFGTFLSDAEIAALSGGFGVYCRMIPWHPPARAKDRGGDVSLVSVHPAQKPVAIMEWCLGFLPNARTILDPFMGSGTTLVACERLGRAGVGIEIDPGYFDIACRRVDEATRQPRLALPEPVRPTQEALL